FFTSRRRHTRWPRDWSSDVCSSDLRERCFDDLGFDPEGFCQVVAIVDVESGRGVLLIAKAHGWEVERDGATQAAGLNDVIEFVRSEERRVGRECRCRVCEE